MRSFLQMQSPDTREQRDTTYISRQEQMSMELIVSDAAVAHLAESGFDKTYGARPVRRSIQTEVEDELADRMLDGEFAAGDKIYVDCSQKKLTFSKR